MTSTHPQQVVTRFVYPPIPIRSFDWCTFYDGKEEAGGYGWRSSEQEAREDLRRRDE
jgi:hypothetical protein